jgi:DNA polymerase-1
VFINAIIIITIFIAIYLFIFLKGSAADLIKLAMINIYHQLSIEPSFKNIRRVKSHPGSGLYRTQDDEVRFLLQIHDELVFEVKKECLPTIARIIKNCMEGAIQLKVPLQVKLEIGEKWGMMKSYTLEE